MKPINKIPRLIRIAAAVLVAGGLAVMVLSAQDDLDTVRQAAEQGDATAQFNLGIMYANRRGRPEGRCRSHEMVPAGCRTRLRRCAVQPRGHVRQWRGRTKGRRRSLTLVPAGRRSGPSRSAVQSRGRIHQRAGRSQGRCRSREMVPAGRRTGPTRSAVQSSGSCTPRGEGVPQGRCRSRTLVSVGRRAGYRRSAVQPRDHVRQRGGCSSRTMPKP